MGRRREDEPQWTQELGDVRPIRDRDKLREPAAATPAAPAPPEAEPVAFEIEEYGEQLLGRAPGIDREHLRRLRRGRVEVDDTLDLHGLDAATAKRALQRTLQNTRRSGGRCVLVIHGRGVHSDDGAVLKDAFVDWLSAPPLGPLVMAFASATPEDGGAGATYVLLRRVR